MNTEPPWPVVSPEDAREWAMHFSDRGDAYGAQWWQSRAREMEWEMWTPLILNVIAVIAAVVVMANVITNVEKTL